MKTIAQLQDDLIQLDNVITPLNEQYWNLSEKYKNEVTYHFSTFFKDSLTDDINIEFTGTSIIFRKIGEEVDYLKEIFSIYFIKNYGMDAIHIFNDVQLSYYTTSTISEWELERVVSLGKIARVIIDSKQDMLNQINEIYKSYQLTLKRSEYFDKIENINKQKAEIDKQIKNIKAISIISNLFGEGVNIDKGKYIKLKHNYTPLISNIKLNNISKSGRKATAVYTFINGVVSNEEKVNVNNIISQLT